LASSELDPVEKIVGTPRDVFFVIPPRSQ